MARDRIITWNQKAGRRPGAKQVEKAVKEFFGPRGPSVETDSDRLYIATSKDHWIEVALDSGVVDVITRQANAQTNAIADRLTMALAKRFKGDFEDPSFPDQILSDEDDGNELPEDLYDDEEFV